MFMPHGKGVNQKASIGSSWVNHLVIPHTNGGKDNGIVSTLAFASLKKIKSLHYGVNLPWRLK